MKRCLWTAGLHTFMEAAMLHASREIMKVNVTRSLDWSPDVQCRSRWPASISFLPLRCHPPVGSPHSPWEAVPVERRMLLCYKCIVRSQSGELEVQRQRQPPRQAAVTAMTAMRAMTAMKAACLLGKRRLPCTTSSCLSAGSQMTITLMWALQPLHQSLRFLFTSVILLAKLANRLILVLSVSNGSREKRKKKNSKKHNVTVTISI